MIYKVIQEFPGLEVGDLLVRDEETGLFTYTKEEADIEENREIISISKISFNEGALLDSPSFFEPADLYEIKELEKKLKDMARIAADLEVGLITVTTPYELSVFEAALNKVYTDMDLLKRI